MMAITTNSSTKVNPRTRFEMLDDLTLDNLTIDDLISFKGKVGKNFVLEG